MPSPYSRGQREHRLAFYVPLLNENLLLLNHKCSCDEAGYLKGEKITTLLRITGITCSQRPALAVGSSGRLVKIRTDLHPCRLGFCKAGLHPTPLWGSRQLQRGGLWGHMNCRGGRELDCGKEKERRLNKHGRKERGEGGHKGSPGHSQSALCKQASSWSGQVAGGSPPRASGTVSRADNWWQECGICS